MRRDDAARRNFNNLVCFWQACDRPVCRRNRTCSRDVHACFKRYWPLVPDEEREYLRACIEAAQDTRSPEATHRAGVAARDAYLALQERLASQPAAPDAALQDRATRSEAEVRLRRL